MVEVQDNGGGFDTRSRTAGFGLAGMRERVYLAGGTLEIESSDDGTRLRARLPRDSWRRARDRFQSPIRWRRRANCTSSARLVSASLE